MAENYYVVEPIQTGGMRIVSIPPNASAVPRVGDVFGVRDPNGNIYEFGYFSSVTSPTVFTPVGGSTNYGAARLAGRDFVGIDIGVA